MSFYSRNDTPASKADQRLRESIAAHLYLALSGEPVSWDGECYRIVDVWLQDSGRLVVTIQRDGEQTISVTL